MFSSVPRSLFFKCSEKIENVCRVFSYFFQILLKNISNPSLRMYYRVMNFFFVHNYAGRGMLRDTYNLYAVMYKIALHVMAYKLYVR